MEEEEGRRRREEEAEEEEGRRSSQKGEGGDKRKFSSRECNLRKWPKDSFKYPTQSEGH
jgi:hypothetical protein